AGVSPFGKPTVADTLAAIVEREPTWETLPAATPPHVLQLLRRCLHKDPRRRLRHIADARLEAEDGPAMMPIRGWSAPRKAIASLLAVLGLTSVVALYSLFRP